MPILKILQVSAFFPSRGGGIEVVAHQLAKGFSQKGYQVAHIAGGLSESDVRLAANEYEQINCRYVDVLGEKIGLPMPLWGMSGIKKIWNSVRSNDLIHIHDYLYFPCMLAFVFAKINRKKVVITQHIGNIPFSNLFKQWLLKVLNKYLGLPVLRSCDAVVFVSKTVESYFKSLSMRELQSQVIQNGVDGDLYKPLEKREASTMAEFIFVGRFVEKKGIHLLQQCMDIEGIRWTFVGDGPLSPLNWQGISCSTRVLTGLRGAELVPLYQHADLLVLPSIGEGFPLVVQEALSCGTPVLVNDEVALGFQSLDSTCVYSIPLVKGSENLSLLSLRSQLRTLSTVVKKLRDARDNARDLSQQWSWKTTVIAYKCVYKMCTNVSCHND